MRLHDIAFYIILFFLFGIFIANTKLNFLTIVVVAALIAALFLFFGYFNIDEKPKFFWFAGFSLFIIIGALYYILWASRQIEDVNVLFNKKIEFQGVIIDYPQSGNAQNLIIQLQKPYSGNILAKLPLYPQFEYGDLAEFKGVIKIPESSGYKNYLAAKNIFGVIDFPIVELKAKNRAFYIKAKLFRFKKEIIANFQKALPPEKAAFLAGITIGEQAEFSKEFKEAMKKSGTSHIVALSGYNITIIAIAISSVFGFIFKRRLAFCITIIMIIAFVLMAGAEASVVRAAIMGGIVMLGRQISRAHSMRNIIAVAALVMILINPRILRFDLGFQLSFLALIGIIYFAPFIKKILKIEDKARFLNWRKNLLETTSAQLAVAPLLIINLGNFHITSLLANILILEVIPITMFLGFIIAAMGFVSAPFSIIIGWFASLFISYEFAIIDIFSKITI